VKKIDAKLEIERQKTRTALKDLAYLETKLAKLGELSDQRGLKVSELQTVLKADKKAAVADLSLQKKINKKELKTETDLALAKVKAQASISKDVESSKRLLQKKFDGQLKTLQLLQKAFAESKRRSSELSAHTKMYHGGTTTIVHSTSLLGMEMITCQKPWIAWSLQVFPSEMCL
jgi:hypothetical protein